MLTPMIFRDLTLRVDQRGCIAEDVLCRGCGYNLRRLSPDQACPECGKAIATSVLRRHLRFADARWLTGLSHGMALIALHILGWLTLALALTFGPREGLSGAAGMVLSISLLGAAGLWLFTVPEPDLARSPSSRSIARSCGCAAATVMAIAAIMAMFGRGGATAVGSVALLGIVLGLITLVSATRYARFLARRLPDDTFVDHASIVMWGLLVCAAMLALLLQSSGVPMSAAMQRAWELPRFLLGQVCMGAPISMGLLVLTGWALLLTLRLSTALRQAAAVSRSERMDRM